ncbi:MAG TPA: enoyl-CoA hydratase [Blastocatellia bacterium]|jgi:enoyl-CoA hydratase|nr:enoyl-CoA hydratase [Blastocatellia bacterium]HCX30552.1 enoyl-CoA hydratase [Blastocatellia bacterium]
MSSILFERHQQVAIIRLNRPEKFNALSREMILALTDLFKGFERQSELRAVILTGAGEKAFCAGTDITELTGLDKAGARAVAERGQTLCNEIENCGVPVIAAINGIAAGGGCELALACHIRIAAPNASFSLPETKLGIIPGYGGTQRLAREIGEGRALEMMLTARSVNAEEALRVGLINRITSRDVLAEAEALAKEIASLAPLALRACLEAVTRGLALPIAEGLALETKLFASLFATGDVKEGTRAFLEKRLPVFKGI